MSDTVRSPARPYVLGLTGSIGMGKSTVAAMLRESSVPVFDADAQVRQLQGPEGALLAAIEAAFPGTTGPEGVDRNQLGARVFHDTAALARLEAIIHPAVARARADFLGRHGAAPLVVYDIPLLFEKGYKGEMDGVAVVSAPLAVQKERVLARPGMTEAKFTAILELQMADAEKCARADYIINTGCPLEDTRRQVAALITRCIQALE